MLPRIPPLQFSDYISEKRHPAGGTSGRRLRARTDNPGPNVKSRRFTPRLSTRHRSVVSDSPRTRSPTAGHAGLEARQGDEPNRDDFKVLARSGAQS